MATQAKNSKKSYDEAQLASYWNFRFKEAMVAKAPYTKRWKMYWDAYHGEYFKNKNIPEYKSDLVTNYIFSIVETIRPIMLDNDPKFQALPRQPEGMQFANDIQEAFDYEWDRDSMSNKLYRELISTLVIGNVVWFIAWDNHKKQITAIPVNAFNVFPDPLATSVDDAEYIIYASYKNVYRLKQQFPHRADELVGGDIQYDELVYENSKDTRVDDQVLILEVWTTDYDSFEEDDEGNVKPKYPHGRVITLAPELGVVLADRPAPYRSDAFRFPFVVMKDYDIPGKFWGEGEVAQLLSPQKYMNELNNSILDNAKATANMPWIVDKNAGIPRGQITNRPGLILRKNPGTEVRREQPPTMPNYVINAVETYKGDMEQISGIFNSVKGNSETGVYTAQGILALQEAGQARARLKVKLMEDALGRVATMWFERMRQFWTENRWIRTVKPDGTYDVREFKRDVLSYEYDIKILAGSTMPVNRSAMLDLMIRLAQTQMPDGQALVDREAVVEYLPSEVRSSMLRRMGERSLAVEQQIAELTETMEGLQQQLEEFAQQSMQNDEETFDVIEDITKAIEDVNSKILQLQEEHDIIMEDTKREQERLELKQQAYNEGYADAERALMSSDSSNLAEESIPLEGGMLDEDEPLEEGLGEEPLGEGMIPDDILDSLDELSDEELELLLAQYPQLASLIR